MRISCACLLLAVSLVGCAPPPAVNKSTPATPSASPPATSAPAGDPQAAFVAAFRQASERKDVDQMLKLYCWDGVDAEMRETVRGNVEGELRQPVTDLQLAPSEPGKYGPTVEGGIHWKPNLTVVAILKAKYAPAPPGSGLHVGEANHTLGLQGGQYRMTVPVREK